MTKINKIRQKLTNLAQSDLPLMERKRKAVKVSGRFQDPLFAEKVLVQFQQEMKYAPNIDANYNPNGFYKIRLFKTDGTALRLHVNDPDSGIPEGGRKQEDVHDHRWDLYSATLAGTINYNIFGHCPEHMPSARTFYEYEYGPRGGKNEFEMTYRGPAYLRWTDHIIAPSGSLTVMDAYKIHQAYYPGETELTATMVVTDEARGRTKNSVFANSAVHHIIQKSNGTTPTPAICRDQAIQLVDKTVAALRARRAQQQKHAPQKPGLR